MKETWRAPWLVGALPAAYSDTVMVMGWDKVLAGMAMVTPPPGRVTVAGWELLTGWETTWIGVPTGVGVVVFVVVRVGVQVVVEVRVGVPVVVWVGVLVAV